MSELSVARELKTEATAERKRGNHARALQCLDESLALLQEILDDEAPGSVAARAVQGELADSQGMRGGILRRIGRLSDALQAYRAGERLEAQLGYASTYNLVNVIALSIELDQLPPTAPELKSQIGAAIKALVRDTQGRRRQDWWAWADLAQVLLLDGQADAARRAQVQGKLGSGPAPEELRVHAEGLTRLAQQLQQLAPEVAAALQAAATEVVG